jgi:hypothetical protein
MSEARTRDLVKALAMKAVLERAAARPKARAAARAPAAAPARPPARARETPANPRRAAAALVFLAVGAVTMLAFESTLTRVIGVAALFGFVVAGAFAIADPRWLGSAPELNDTDASATRRRG